jgi:hypothetical protein
MLTVGVLNAQTQIGLDIDGEAEGDEFGRAVSMPDATTVAIGAPKNAGKGWSVGKVSVYNWVANSWVQKGMDIYGEAEGDEFGQFVSMADANTLAVGSPYNDGNGKNDVGNVRVYSWNGNRWVQKGDDIDGDSLYDRSGVVCMPDSNTIAIGAAENDANGTWSGQVRIYYWNGISWKKKGKDIYGEASWDLSGCSIDMPDANTIAVGAELNDGVFWGNNDVGHVRIYVWNGVTWLQKGDDIDGEAPGDYSGFSVSMPDSNIIAIGAPQNDGSGKDAGQVRVYTWNGNKWIQKGLDIDGESPGDNSGRSICMVDSNTIAIGAPKNRGNSNLNGHVRLYNWDGTSWKQRGSDIDGEFYDDQFGSSVNMPNPHTVAIGAPFNKGSDVRAGQVRVFDLNTLSVWEKEVSHKIDIFPNPTQRVIYVKVKSNLYGSAFSIFDNNGKMVLRGILNSEITNISIDELAVGNYHFFVDEKFCQIFSVLDN